MKNFSNLEIYRLLNKAHHFAKKGPPCAIHINHIEFTQNDYGADI